MDTINGIISEIRYKKLDNCTPYAIKNFIIAITCIIQANPVRIISNIMKIANNCRLKYRFIIFIIQSIKPKFPPVKNKGGISSCAGGVPTLPTPPKIPFATNRDF
jgi:hypothetical protein